MAKIALVVANLGPKKTHVLRLLLRASSLAIGDILKRTKGRLPIIELEIAGHDLVQRASVFQRLVHELQDAGASFAMFELSSYEQMETLDPAKLIKVDTQMLGNLVSATLQDRSFREMRSSSSLDTSEPQRFLVRPDDASTQNSPHDKGP